MADSDELDEILNEIKNINTPNNDRKKAEASTPTPQFKHEVEEVGRLDDNKKEDKEDKGVSFDEFTNFNSAEKNDTPKVVREEAKMPTQKREPKRAKITSRLLSQLQ